jgi:hypothetical protein
MNCGICGEPNDDNAYKCTKCGRLLHWKNEESPKIKRYVPNYLVQSILVTLLCCLPFRIVALVYSNKVNSRLLLGNEKGAIYASNQAKTWCWISFGVGLAFGIIGIIIRLYLIEHGHRIHRWR